MALTPASFTEQQRQPLDSSSHSVNKVVFSVLDTCFSIPPPVL